METPLNSLAAKYQASISLRCLCLPTTYPAQCVMLSHLCSSQQVAAVVSQVIVGVAARDLSGPQQVELLEVGRGEGRG